MPFSPAFKQNRFIATLQRLRSKSAIAYGIALTAFVIAALGRFGLEGYLAEGLPFITFYPAVIFAALFGIGPGVLVLVLSTTAGWFAFLPPYYSFSLEHNAIGTLTLFLLLGAIDIAIVVFL